MMEFFDAHCHIKSEDAGTFAGVFYSPGEQPARVVCATSPDDWDAVLTVVRGWPGSIPALGLHPWLVADALSGWESRLEQLLTVNADCLIGESGLDRLTGRLPQAPLQEKAFAVQAELAIKLGRPMIVHCVKAWEQVVGILDGVGWPPAILMHGFDGPPEGWRAFLSRGSYFSVNPRILSPNRRRWREAAKDVPRDRIVLESDAFLVPGSDAEEELTGLAEGMADVFGMTKNELLRTAKENALAFVGTKCH